MTVRQRLTFGIVGVFLALWLMVMFFWVRGVMWRWDHTFAIRVEAMGFKDYDRPKAQILPRLALAETTLEEAGYSVWVEEDWKTSPEGVQHVTRFARGWYPRISGEIRLNMYKRDTSIERLLNLKVGGKPDQKQQIDELGRQLEQKLLFD